MQTSFNIYLSENQKWHTFSSVYVAEWVQPMDIIHYVL